MNIAVLSGKGGTGKTFTAVNLATTAAMCNRFNNVTYLDCDVEEPNGHLYFKPENVVEYPVSILLPDFDFDKCSGCRKCVDFCHFNALMFIKEKPKLFPEVCHSCGGCQLVCKDNAISEKEYNIGRIITGTHNGINVVSGMLNIGEASGNAVIKDVIKTSPSSSESFNLIDCPPGCACSVMESIAKADYCIITTEPTAYGFDNFRMVVELTDVLQKKIGVIINKQTTPYKPLEDYCKENNLPIIKRIAYDNNIAALSSEGMIAVEHNEKLYNTFLDIIDYLTKTEWS